MATRQQTPSPTLATSCDNAQRIRYCLSSKVNCGLSAPQLGCICGYVETYDSIKQSSHERLHPTQTRYISC
eukprot:jgi/Chrzof1/4310/Cz14g08130.t1